MYGKRKRGGRKKNKRENPECGLRDSIAQWLSTQTLSPDCKGSNPSFGRVTLGRLICQS
jgi:hypothetical protein